MDKVEATHEYTKTHAPSHAQTMLRSRKGHTRMCHGMILNSPATSYLCTMVKLLFLS